MHLLIWASSGVGAIASALLAFWVLSQGPRNRATRLFALTILTVALWGFLEFELRTATDLAAARLWTTLLPLGWAWAPLLFLLFALEMARHPWRRRGWVRALWGLPPFFIVLAFVDSLLYRDPRPMWWGWAVNEGPLWPLATLYFGLLPLLGLWVLFRKARTSPSHEQRRQLWIIIFGALMPYIPALLINGLLPMFTLTTGTMAPVPGLAFVGAFLMSLVIAVGVVRYQVFRPDSPGVLEAVFASVEEGILLLDRRGIVRLYSPALLAMFRLDEEVLGLPFHEVFLYEHLPLDIPDMRVVRCLLNGERRVVLERRSTVKIDHRFLGEVVLWVNAEAAMDAARELQKGLEQFREAAMLDPLTGVYNRRHMEDRLHEALAHHARYRIPATLLLLDLDRFKDVNDRNGHRVGDSVLVDFARFLQETVRRGDLVFRYGGDEFCILLPNTHEAGGLRLAQRILEGLKGRTFGEMALPLQVSIGVAELVPTDHTPQHWLERADRALYLAKQKGRGQAVCARMG